MSKSTERAAPAAVTAAANAAMLVGFDAHVVADAMRAMSEKRGLIDNATGEMRDAGVTLILHAHAVATATRDAGSEANIADEWTKSLAGLYPMLAAEGSRFIKVTDKGEKGVTYSLTGYGMNVNSTARGFCQYADITPEDAKGEDGTLSYGGLRALVEKRRREDESDEARAVREAREALDAAIKAYRAAAIDGGKASQIREFADALTRALEPEADEPESDGETTAPAEVAAA